MVKISCIVVLHGFSIWKSFVKKTSYGILFLSTCKWSQMKMWYDILFLEPLFFIVIALQVTPVNLLWLPGSNITQYCTDSLSIIKRFAHATAKARIKLQSGLELMKDTHSSPSRVSYGCLSWVLCSGRFRVGTVLYRALYSELGMSPWQPLLGLLSRCPIFKSSHCNSFGNWAHRFHPWVPDLQMSFWDMITW